MNADELKTVLDKHTKLLNNEKGGERADLSGANLRGANLTDIALTNAVGGNNRIQCLQVDPYKIIILDNEIVWGGRTKKTVKEWLAYKGDELGESDKYYLTKITKPFIRICLAKAQQP